MEQHKQWHVQCKTDVEILQLPGLNQDHSKSLGREVWMFDIGVIHFMDILFESICREITQDSFRNSSFYSSFKL